MRNKNIFPVHIKKLFLFSRFVLLLGFLCFSFDVFALREELRTQIQGQQIATDSLLRNRDPLMSVNLSDLDDPLDPTWYNGINMYRVRNRIKLEVNPYVTNSCMPDTFICSVTIRIKRLDKDYTLDSLDQTLTVTYDSRTGKLYNGADIYAFEGYHYVEVKILSVSCGDAVAEFLILKNEIDIDRFYDISLSTGPTISSVSHLTATKEIEVTWTYISGIVPEEYDLEWTFVDNYKSSGQFYTASETNYNFKNNSTRITTKNNSYKISAAFERGFLLFRVRAVGKTGAHYTHRINGPWSTTTESGLVSGYTSGSRIEITSGIEHQPTLNWQFSATYAEEGKKKEVISYFDGSLRNRQTVTRSNTDTTAIATETIYDHQGRPAINTLPVPTAANILKYYPDFNLNLSDVPYSRSDFDLDIEDDCATETPAMAIDSGASRYYSVNNPYQSLSTHYKYIPDAFGYAFTQVQYMPDNTGRINKQSGVGEDHIIGSGHETQYFYGVPEQLEIDRLFGNSVGYREHYQKNMVVDANGQVSVSYLNLAGKTIATSLAGALPSNVDSLSSFVQPLTLKVDLQNSSDTTFGEGVIKLSKTFLVTHTGVYTFDYSMEADTFESDCLPSEVCLDCVYDLEISLTDMCENNLLDGDVNTGGTNLLKRTIGKLSSDYDSACRESAIQYTFEEDADLNDSINVTLTPGKYTITKTLTVNREAMEFYANVFVRNNTCLKTLDSFKTEYLEATDFSGCGITCEECEAQLGDKDTFLMEQVAALVEDSVTVTGADTAYINSLYDSLMAECRKPCEEPDPCELNLMLLKADISPGGQYALLAEEGVYIDSTTLNPNGYKYGGNYQYKKTGSVYVKMQYTDGNGNLDSIVYDDVMTSPADLPYDAFVSYFRESWADSLVQFHPEYCNYEWCIKNKNSFVYDQRMLNTPTYEQAYDSGYLNPMRMPLAGYGGTVLDPYFGTTWGSGDSTAIKNTMSIFKTYGGSNYSMWQIPLIMFHCNDFTLQADINTCLSSLTMSDPTCAPEQNSMWRSFRAMYLAEKKKLMEARMGSEVTCASSGLIKQKRFYTTGDAENLSATSGAATVNEAKDSLRVQCTETCKGYVEIWMFKLRGCNLNATDSAALADSLVRVCTYGCDVNNPAGSSSVAPAYQTGTTPGYKTFQQAVKAIADFVPGICDAGLIGYPMEYGHDYFATTNPHADTCACNKIPAPTSDTACACNETDDSLRIHLLREFEFEEEDKCKTCIECEELAMALSDLDNEYEFVIADTTTGLREILQNGLNKQLSFNLIFEDYLKFMSECLSDTIIKDSTLLYFRYKFRHYMIPPPEEEEGEMMMMMGEDEGDGGGGFELLSGGGGSSGMVPLDTCACNLMLDIKKNYDALVPPRPPFNDYVLTEFFTRGIGCETGGYDFEAAMNLCRDAYEMDSENLPFHAARGWNSTQYNNFLLTADDEEMEFPEGCVCEAVNDTLPQDTGSRGCEETARHALFWYMSSDSAAYFYANNDLEGLAAFRKRAEQGYPTYFDNGTFNLEDHLTEEFVSRYCRRPWSGPGTRDSLGIPCLDCPYFTPPPCETCYTPNEDKLDKVQDFLNELTTGYKAGNYMVRNGWRLVPDILTYPYDALFYGGSFPNALKYHIGSWNVQSPTLDFRIKDTTGHLSFWNLNFPGAHRFYQYNYIIEFSDITAIYPSDCNNSPYFSIKAKIKKPDKFGGDTIEVYMTGRAGNIDLFIEDSICSDAKLCNKPLLYAEEDTADCRTSLTLLAHHNAEVAYGQYIDSVKKAFRAQYMRQCMEARKTEVFTMRYGVQEYHYTLYYYDQAGNLVQTVPPSGVNMLTGSTLISVHGARLNNLTPILPSHTFNTKYKFNTLNQLAQQATPDGGTTDFWYDAVGRLVVSRNAKQATQSPHQYSYTVFDALGRITEVGQLASSDAMTVAKAFDPGDLQSWLDAADADKEQITRTFYDNVEFTSVQTRFTGGQLYLRKRVASTTISAANDGSYQHAVHYSYDVHGYVNTLVRENRGITDTTHRYKRLDYEYDLLSGNVHKVLYQHGHTDRFYHRYLYDADNRITHAYTSPDGVTWDNDARYQYYRHGPLMRTEIGELKVQGTDYAYTIQGWLKGVNSNTLRTHRDIGQDAKSGGAYPWVAQDVFGFTLGYYEGEFTPVGSITTTNYFEADYSPSVFNGGAANLYNGNIRHMVTTVSVLSGGTPLGSAYRYDQLNRLARAEYYNNINLTTNEWDNTGGRLEAYRNTFTYDANGNILTQNRHGHATTPTMDSMTYHYTSGTNQLNYVDDVVSSGNYSDDIDDQSSNNYLYDEIGNLIRDNAEEIHEIEWTVYGKIKRITRSGGSTKPDLEFKYSPDGHRVMKKEIPASGPETTTWYVRDAQGNIMSIYEERSDTVILEELGIFGSSRLGMVKPELNLTTATLDTVHYQLKRGQKRYELSNHLGNVLAVVTDKHKGLCQSDTISYFNAEVLFAYDYSPFGAILPQRSFAYDTSCVEVVDYDTTFNDHYEVTFNATTLLSPGQTIRLTDGVNSTTIGTYNAGFVNPLSYKAQIITNVSPTGDGIQYITQSGSTIKLRFSADSLGFDCGDTVRVIWGNSTLTFVTIDCAVDSIFAVDTSMVCDNGTGYRFGFNGMEKDNEAKGVGNSYDFAFRIYDSRLGRFLSIDPLTAEYPWYTPYQFAGNNPIKFIDLEGLEPAERKPSRAERQRKYGAIDQIFVDDPKFSGIIGSNPVKFVHFDPEARIWIRQTVEAGDPTKPVITVIRINSTPNHQEYIVDQANVLTQTFEFDFADASNATTDAMENDLKEMADILTKDPEQTLVLQGNTEELFPSDIVEDANINGVTGDATGEQLADSRASVLQEKLIGLGVPAAKIIISPNGYASTRNTTATVVKKVEGNSNLPVPEAEIVDR